MPVVPFTARPNQSQPIPKVDPTFLMMAAAELHEAGRLVESTQTINEEHPKVMNDPYPKVEIDEDESDQDEEEIKNDNIDIPSRRPNTDLPSGSPR